MIMDRLPAKTRKLSELNRLINPSLPTELMEQVLLLDRFYIPTRYPDALPGSLESGLPNQSDANESLSSQRSAPYHNAPSVFFLRSANVNLKLKGWPQLHLPILLPHAALCVVN